jgi:hypothetical protein
MHHSQHNLATIPSVTKQVDQALQNDAIKGTINVLDTKDLFSQ